MNLDDFCEPTYCFASIQDPAPIVKGAVEKGCKGYVWIGTVSQARNVRDNLGYVAVMEQGHKINPRTGEIVPSGYYFSALTEANNFDLLEPCTRIPEEVML